MIQKKLQFIQKSYIDILFYVLFFAFCMYKSIKADFWYDELSWTLNFMHQKSILQMLHELSTKIYNLPGYYIILYPFYQISHNHIWLRLPSIIMTLIAIFYTQKLADKYYGRYCKLIIWLLFLFTPFLYFITLQLRPYAFMIACSSFSFYMFYKKQEYSDKQNLIKYGIALTLAAYSHWFGCILVASYGIIDAYLFLRKKNNITFIIPYLICFILFVPWAILTFTNNQYNISSYWGANANYFNVIKIIYNIAGSRLTFLLFMSSFLMLFIKKNLKNTQISPEHSAAFVILFILFTVVTYSTIQPSGSLMETRYFFVFIPQYLILTTSLIIEITHRIRIKNSSNLRFLLIFSSFAILFYTIGDINNIFTNNIPRRFANYKKLIQFYNKEAVNKKVLVWFLEQKFLDIYNLPDNINVVSFTTNDNYDATFTNTYSKDFPSLHKLNNEIIKTKEMSCKDGIKYILDQKKISLHFNYKNGKNDISLFDKNICDYDIIYIENKVTYSSILYSFLNMHFHVEQIIINPSEDEHIFRLERKKQP